MYSDVAVIIPSRIGSQRLPRKPLEVIGDRTMIEHVVLRVKDAGVDNVYVATDSDDIANIAGKVGAKAIMTGAECATGTDRVYKAFGNLENKDNINYVVNVQGDMPFIDGRVVTEVIRTLKSSGDEIVTPVVKVDEQTVRGSANVTVVADKNNRALYFSRNNIPYGAKEFLYHVGIYGFRADSLQKFVELEQTEYEKSESLEQLRALENGMQIGICFSNEVPISVDTAEDLAKARSYFQDNQRMF